MSAVLSPRSLIRSLLAASAIVLLTLSKQLPCCYSISASSPSPSSSSSSSSTSSVLSLHLLHRFSAKAREFAARKQLHWPPATAAAGALSQQDYYRLLHTQDRLHQYRRRSCRRLARDHDQTLYFSSGNKTTDYGEALGWLHYAVIDIGTPNTSFLVALDTGSYLLWVPCKCQQCAPTTASTQELDISLNVYNPAASATSDRITCDNSICEPTTDVFCGSQSADCPYSVHYLSDNTSTSGILIKDVIHMTSESHPNVPLKIPLIFGCGRVQSGGFLDGGAPDGLLGLGTGKMALPSYLAEAGLVKDSFSMCFQPDNSGRIFFGDTGVASQQTTPLLKGNSNLNHQFTVGLDSISVGSKTLDVKGLHIIIDTGTSFTYLPRDAYSRFTHEFDLQVRNKKISSVNLPWEYCYELGGDDNYGPEVSLVFRGGGNFSVYNPLIGLTDENGTLDAFCLAVSESEVAILGQSFMTGYQLVFNQGDSKLGWFPTDCYRLSDAAAASLPSHSPSKDTPSPKAPSGIQAPPLLPGSPPKASGAIGNLLQQCNSLSITTAIILIYLTCLEQETFL